jgi:hypothetical protein
MKMKGFGRDWEKLQKPIAGVPAQIQTNHLPTTSQVPYRPSNHFGKWRSLKHINLDKHSIPVPCVLLNILANWTVELICYQTEPSLCRIHPKLFIRIFQRYKLHTVEWERIGKQITVRKEAVVAYFNVDYFFGIRLEWSRNITKASLSIASSPNKIRSTSRTNYRPVATRIHWYRGVFELTISVLERLETARS